MLWGSVVFLQIHAGVKAGHLIPVAVEHQGVALEKFPEASLLGLAPARMIHCWLHIGIETVFVGSEAIPRRGRLLFLKTNFHQRLGALESIFPRNHHAHRRADRK